MGTDLFAKGSMNARALKIPAAAKLLPLLLLLALPAVAQAQYYFTNGLEVWSYYPNTGPVTITGYSGSGRDGRHPRHHPFLHGDRHRGRKCSLAAPA